MKTETRFDCRARLLSERQEKRYDRMARYRDQHRRLADKIIKLEMRMEKLQHEIDH